MKALTKRVNAFEAHFGESIVDPYRWLEADVQSDAEVAAWALAQQL